MKLIIAGGRDYWLTRADFAKLDAIHLEFVVVEEICGMALGTDVCGKVWAIMHGIPVRDFPADWPKFGRQAGFVRNTEMAKYGTACALFPGNTGTQNMFEAALRHKLRIFDFRVSFSLIR